MIKAYLRYRRAVFGFFLSVLLFFPLVFALYGVELRAAGYSVLIFTFLFAVWAAADYGQFRGRMRKLEDTANRLSSYAQTLPVPGDPTEERYQEIIARLYGMIEETTVALNKAHGEQLDYYTLWVHQIKTPISAIALAIQQEGKEDPVVEQELFKIERYVEMALQYAKMGDLSADLMIRQYPLEEIVNQSVKKYAPLFIFKKLSVELRDLDRTVDTDSKWFSFILEQLLSNAVKYTARGGVAIFWEKEKNRLVVRDTGVGIRQEDIRRVFAKGYTGTNGRMDKRATGLGLYMAKQVADQLSVGLSLESAPGQGTRAILTFPQESPWQRDGYLTKM